MGFFKDLFKLGVNLLAQAIAQNQEQRDAELNILSISGNEVETEVRLQKNEERYLFRFTNKDLALFHQTLGRFASDPELSFDWNDAEQIMTRLPYAQS